MKAGVAAMLIAARAFGKKLAGTPGIVLVLTAAEENGCVGSQHLAALPKLMGKAGAIVVGEPTSNYPMVGHKGSIKFHAAFRGVSAHGRRRPGPTSSPPVPSRKPRRHPKTPPR